MTDKPTIGGECPNCGYTPLYLDGGELVCVGCEAHFDLEPQEPTEEVE